MTLKERLKKLRGDVGLSQKAIGSQGFVSVPGWVKIEGGQRQPSDILILRLVSWLLRREYVTVTSAGRLLEELLTLKHINNRSAFVRRLARDHAEELFGGTAITVSEDPAVFRTKPHRKRRTQKKL